MSESLILTTLSFSIYSNPGTYALLLGSGVSRAANIPTGWGIECDLINKLAASLNQTIKENEHDWYKKQFGEEASYSGLLEKLVETKTERVQLMKGYFEPNEQDIELGYKQPTKAHKAIAQLMKDGYIKVVVTTNFDRLLERSLEDIDVIPQVVYKDEDWDSITPIVHSDRPTIIKINGDYIDCTFRNTEGELDKYPPKTTKQLCWIFENYGLITCGWSGVWDKGLIQILQAAEQSRYSTILSYINNPGKVQDDIAENRNGKLLKIKDANNLFTEMKERIEALAETDQVNELEDKIVVSRIKKYLSTNEFRIKFADLMSQLSDNAVKIVWDNAHYDFSLTRESFEKYVDLHMKAIHQLLLVTPDIIRWGNEQQIKTLGEVIVKLCLKPFVNGEATREGTQYLHAIAPTILLNAVGTCCIKYKRFKELDWILSLQVPEHNFFHPLPAKLLFLVGDDHWGHVTFNSLLNQNYYYPYSIFIREKLKKYLEKCFIDESTYNDYFNIWEHLKSLIYAYKKCYLMPNHIQFPLGLFLRDYLMYNKDIHGYNPYINFFEEADSLKEEWEPIRQGMFDGKWANYKDINDKAKVYYKNHWR